MNELRKKILEILVKHQLSGFSTMTEDNKPWVRYVMTKGEKDMTIRFATFINTRKVQQINNYDEVHLTCGVTDPRGMTPYLQISGKARLSTRPDDKLGFWNPELANIFDGPDDKDYGVIVVEPYRIEYTIPGIYEPEVWIKE